MSARVLSWDGTRARWGSEREAIAWAREHLRAWMEAGDRLVRWTTAKGNTVVAVHDGEGPIDAHVIVGAA